MNRKLSAAAFVTALAFTGVACDNDDAGDVGDDIDEGVDDVEDEVDGE
ncbi:MAG: hypothetical protein H0V52_02255 [Acidimicrobiia bacterium]|nr:hypothetical protein [Acidimicrobiia bacterium]